MPNTTYGTPYVQSSDLVSSYPGTSSTLATRIDQVSYAGNGLNNQTGTSYTLVLTDVGKTVTLSNGSAVTVTIPSNASVAAPLGSIVRFSNLGSGTVTIQPTGGVTLNGGNLTVSQYGAVQIIKLATDTWGVIESTGVQPGLSAVSPTSIANSGGTASLSGSAVTFSGVNSVSLNGIFTSTYANYMVQIQATASTSVNCYVRLRASGTDTTSGYQSRYMQFYTGYATNTATDKINPVTIYAANSAFTIMNFNNPQVAAYTTYVAQSQTNDTGYSFGEGAAGAQQTNTQFDGITVYPNVGTITGTIRVYGYRN